MDDFKMVPLVKTINFTKAIFIMNFLLTISLRMIFKLPHLRKILLTCCSCIMMAIPFDIHAQPKDAAPGTPKLVVGIVVDQMKYDYVFRFWNKFGEGGFKKLVNQGFFCKNASYNFIPTYTAPGHACIYTGTTPAVNGIISNDWFCKDDGGSTYCVQDTMVMPVGSNSGAGNMSPRNLLTTTVTDELRYSSNYKSKVISISIKDRGAILPGGHSANAAYWFDGSNGHFISSTYYMKELPKWAGDFNALGLPAQYLSKPWNTLLPIEQYTESTADNTPYEEPFYKEALPVFPHNLPALKQGNFELVKRTPHGNTIVKEFAIAALKNEKLGQSEATDFLAISFSSTDYVGHQFGCNAIETQDTYLRLDKDLEELFSILEKTVGKQNVLIFLTADHAAVPNPRYLKDHGVPAGLFDINAVQDSLNKFMTASYGAGNWIAGVYDDQVYFNKRLLDEKKIRLSEVSDRVAEFLLRFNGIAHVVTGGTLSTTEFTEPPLSLLQKGYNRKLSGDVLFLLSPGLIEYRERGTTHGSPYTYDTHVPLFFYGWKVPQGSTSEEIMITDIAPTLSNWLNIEFPNGSTGRVITSIIK